MPTKKIADLPSPCRHPDHNPPRHMVLDDGVYEHTCPGCGQSHQFIVSKPTMTARIELPACPTTLGDVWVGKVQVTAETIAMFGTWPCF